MTKQEQADKLFGKNEVVKRIWINLPYETLKEASVLLDDKKGFDNYMNKFKRAENNKKASWLVEHQIQKYHYWLIKKFKV